MPWFCPVWPEDSHFLPRCRHGPASLLVPGTGGIGETFKMTKTTGRMAVMVMAGLVLLIGAAAQAAPAPGADSGSDSAGKQADTAKPGKHRRQTTRHSSNKVAQLPANDKAAKDAVPPMTAQASADDAAPSSGQLPPDVANANAQIAAADTAMAAAASAMASRANDNLQAAAEKPAGNEAETQLVEPDQLNDLDRALPQDNPPAQKAVIAAVDAQPRPTASSTTATSASSEPNSAWDQSSLIGKIFIGVGALLTFASAARMFMA